jgi:hypothetical protein
MQHLLAGDSCFIVALVIFEHSVMLQPDRQCLGKAAVQVLVLLAAGCGRLVTEILRPLLLLQTGMRAAVPRLPNAPGVLLPLASYKLQVLRIRSRAFACLSLCSSVRKLEKNRSGS